MDDKILNKRLRSKVAMHMLFGLGGAVVIIGALFKILHLEIGPITGGLVLGLGLGTEALIFTVSALNTGEIKEEHQDFVKKVKSSGAKKASSGGGDEGLSSKIDALMEEAKLDVKLMNSLADSIKGLETSAKALSPATEAITASQTYSAELASAASNLEQLNLNYQNQLKKSTSDLDFNDKVNENAEQLRAQMESLSANLAALNNVYGGMLNAMNKK
ncbi:gliding motility protein GldL [Flavobacteriaceae bacterium]|jgi:gliding motility-associated protein GldL|nr:gliding motility protein GldL [Flavobacteriaceae bacterium]MDA9577354.1 gliding motility protein GldL [Flavobacteriaceae bacterium]MDA9833534.1 gliding motility protein GldL [Flavobacteriaceae bacterium]MDB4129240.1 gliding motility protein GldL [Flavobacteriaceae bacterium]MDB4159492.1 gliding motility protein GldL [Flavobacteriaceae bacterium]